MAKKKKTSFSARFPVRTSTALETLADNVRDLRKARDLSQAALAGSEISKIENARGNPTVLFAERLAEALGVPLADLFVFRSRTKSD